MKQQWICTRCGGSETEVLLDRPSLDDRYALGRCRCSPPPATPLKKDKPLPAWPPVQLVAAEYWRPELLKERLRKEREAKLVAGKKPHMTAADHAEAAEIRRRWDAQWER